MLKRLQKRVFRYFAFVLTIIVTLTVGTIDVLIISNNSKDAREKLSFIIDIVKPEHLNDFDDKNPPKEIENFENYNYDAEMPYRLRYFAAVINEEGSIVTMDLSHIASVSNKEATSYVLYAIYEQKESGTVGKYFRYQRYPEGENTCYIFLDVTEDTRVLRFFIIMSIVAWILCGSLMLVISYFASKRMVQPVIEGYEKQHRFISDASHEIKTPIAIISANAEVIELTSGESEWTRSILHQTKRLTELVKNLLTVAKMDEESAQYSMHRFYIYSVFIHECENFSALASNNGKKLDYSASEGIYYTGNENNIRSLLGILIDNAIKYASEGSTIKCDMTAQGKKIFIRCENTVDEPELIEPERFFDRFYRSNDSRQTESGYGMGLSIARSIVDAHSGMINAKLKNNKLIIEVQL